MAVFRVASILMGFGLALPAPVLSQPVLSQPAPTTGPAKPAAPGAKTGAAQKPATSSKAAAAPGVKPAVAAKPAHPPVVAPPEPAKPEIAKTPPKAGVATVGSVTGLPLPRFAALRSDDVNLRVGPGTRYPISWVYKRRELPVQIEREYEIWRLVSDPDGNLGWVHQANLVGRRTFILRGETRTMRKSADDGAAAVAVLKPGVVGRVMNCAAGSAWCEVQVGDYRGYLHRDSFWGTLPGEAIN